MKRFFCALLLAAFLAPLTMGQGDTTIGVVTYRMDARVEDVLGYADPLKAALNIGVDMYETEPAEFCTRNALSEKLARISIAAQQIEILNDLVGLGFNGVVLTPSPPAPDIDPLRTELARIASEMPVVLTARRVTGFELPYFGVDTYQLGVAWTAGIAEQGSRPFVVIGYFADPMQADLLEGLKTSPDFKGSYDVIEENGKKEATQALRDVPDLTTIIVTDSSLVAGVVETTSYVAEELDGFIRVGSFGAPADWETLIADRSLQGFATWDHYALVLQASMALKAYIADGTALEDNFAELIFYGASGEATMVGYPYDAADMFGAFWE